MSGRRVLWAAMIAAVATTLIDSVQLVTYVMAVVFVFVLSLMRAVRAEMPQSARPAAAGA